MVIFGWKLFASCHLPKFSQPFFEDIGNITTWVALWKSRPNICRVTHPGAGGFLGSSWAQSGLVDSPMKSKQKYIRKKHSEKTRVGYQPWFLELISWSTFSKTAGGRISFPKCKLYFLLASLSRWKFSGIVHIGKCHRQSRCDQKGKAKSPTFHTNSTFSHLAWRNNYRLIWQENQKKGPFPQNVQLQDVQTKFQTLSEAIVFINTINRTFLSNIKLQ